MPVPALGSGSESARPKACFESGLLSLFCLCGLLRRLLLVCRCGCSDTPHHAWVQRLSGSRWGILDVVSKEGDGCDLG